LISTYFGGMYCNCRLDFPAGSRGVTSPGSGRGTDATGIAFLLRRSLTTAAWLSSFGFMQVTAWRGGRAAWLAPVRFRRAVFNNHIPHERGARPLLLSVLFAGRNIRHVMNVSDAGPPARFSFLLPSPVFPLRPCASLVVYMPPPRRHPFRRGNLAG
jgi:hypothetical protein